MIQLRIVLLLLTLQPAVTQAQSLDYVSIRKKNGRVVKNFYTGSPVLLQTTYFSYIEGLIEAIRNDSIFIRLYDIRRYQNMLGSIIRDTITSQLLPVPCTEILRVHLHRKRGFFERQSGPLLLIAGGGYLAVNLLNGAFFNLPVTDKANVQRLATAGGLLGLGYFFSRLFASDGFSKKSHRIVYVDL